MIYDAVLEERIGAYEGAEAGAIWAGETPGFRAFPGGMSDRSKVHRVLRTYCNGGPDQIVRRTLVQVNPAEDPALNRLQELLQNGIQELLGGGGPDRRRYRHHGRETSAGWMFYSTLSFGCSGTAHARPCGTTLAKKEVGSNGKQLTGHLNPE